MRPIPRAPVVLFASTVALLFGCGGTIPGEDASGLAESELRTRYDEFPAVLSESEFERWSTARGTLIKGFDRICGDTICSGDFSNLSTLELTCSATSKMKKVKDCVWVLGGSIGYVDGRTGALSTEPRVFTCHIPVAGTANELLSTLTQAGDDALNAPLANGASFYDGLTKCFEVWSGSRLPPPPGPSTATWPSSSGRSTPTKVRSGAKSSERWLVPSTTSAATRSAKATTTTSRFLISPAQPARPRGGSGRAGPPSAWPRRRSAREARSPQTQRRERATSRYTRRARHS